MFNTKTSFQSGQVAVVVLLIMVVLLTIGLSLASRTTQELLLSDQQSESTRVFNAAESGIERALSDVQVGQGTLTVDGVTVQYNVTGSSTLSTRVNEGASVHIDLTNYNNNIVFQWATESACSDRASLVATVFYNHAGTTRTKVIPFRPPCSGHDDNFFNGTTQGANSQYRHQFIIPSGASTATSLPPNALFLRVKPVYADTNLRVSGNTGFPTQYHIISSTASYQGGGEQRNIEVSRTLPAGPAYMDYALYSGGGITQNP